MQSRKMDDDDATKPFDMTPYEEAQKKEDQRIRDYWKQRDKEDLARQQRMTQSTPSMNQMKSASSILPGLSSNMPTMSKPSFLSQLSTSLSQASTGFSKGLNRTFGFQPRPSSGSPASLPPSAAAAAGGYRKTSKGRKGRKTAKKAKKSRKTRKH